jgi:hypothetical protein
MYAMYSLITVYCTGGYGGGGVISQQQAQSAEVLDNSIIWWLLVRQAQLHQKLIKNILGYIKG